MNIALIVCMCVSMCVSVSVHVVGRQSWHHLLHHLVDITTTYSIFSFCDYWDCPITLTNLYAPFLFIYFLLTSSSFWLTVNILNMKYTVPSIQ